MQQIPMDCQEKNKFKKVQPKQVKVLNKKVSGKERAICPFLWGAEVYRRTHEACGQWRIQIWGARKGGEEDEANKPFWPLDKDNLDPSTELYRD